MTAIEFGLYAITEVFAGIAMWPIDRGGEVLERFRELTATARDELTASFRFLHLPPIPAVPELLRGRRVVAVDAAYLGSADDGSALLRALRAIETPLIDTFAMIPAAELRTLHGDPEQPVPGIGDGFAIDELSAAGAEAFVALGGVHADSPLVSLELRHLGGALAVAPPGHGALASLDGDFTVYAVGSPIDSASAAAIHAHLDRVADAMAPWRSALDYLNFADRPETGGRVFGPGTAERLEAVRRRYDPDDVFRSDRRAVDGR